MRIELIGMAAVGLAGTLSAQTSGAFLTRLGRDTVAFEKYTRTADRLEGDVVVTTPRTRITHYVITFGPGGTVRRWEATSRPAVNGPGGTGVVTSLAEFETAAIRVRVERPGRTDTSTIAAEADVLPNAIYTWALTELATAAAARQGRDSVPFKQYAFGGRQVTANAMVRRGADSVSYDFFGNPVYVRVDREGRLLGVSGLKTTLKTIVERLPDLDLPRLVESFAARERAGQTVGTLSPRDTVRVTAVGAELMVDYGRPSRRGRQIWGGVVPYNEVWRTGANAATQFKTSRDLEIGAATVPAGMYTLWSYPTTSGVQLIFNKQIGQWGTEYQLEQDLARVGVVVEKLDAEVERFTISVASEGAGGGELRFDWDRTRWVVPFKVK